MTDNPDNPKKPEPRRPGGKTKRGPMRFQQKTFADFFEEWIEERGDGKRREATIEQYRYMGRIYLVPAFGKFALTDVTGTAVNRFYRDMLRDGFSLATVSHTHFVLAGIFKMAAKKGLVLANPMLEVDAPPKKGRPTKEAASKKSTKKAKKGSAK
jgi:hypothetical protein